MAAKQEKDLIGFDPLAWMNEEADSETETSVEQKEDETTAEIKTNIVKSDEVGQQTAMRDEPEQSATVSSKESKIILDSRLSIQNVASLYEQLVNALDVHQTIEIDASAVLVIDTACLQLLIVLKQTAVKLQKEIQIDFPSDQFIEAAELLGLSEMLEVDQAAADLF